MHEGFDQPNSNLHVPEAFTFLDGNMLLVTWQGNSKADRRKVQFGTLWSCSPSKLAAPSDTDHMYWLAGQFCNELLLDSLQALSVSLS